MVLMKPCWSCSLTQSLKWFVPRNLDSSTFEKNLLSIYNTNHCFKKKNYRNTKRASDRELAMLIPMNEWIEREPLWKMNWLKCLPRKVLIHCELSVQHNTKIFNSWCIHGINKEKLTIDWDAHQLFFSSSIV